MGPTSTRWSKYRRHCCCCWRYTRRGSCGRIVAEVMSRGDGGAAGLCIATGHARRRTALLEAPQTSPAVVVCVTIPLACRTWPRWGTSGPSKINQLSGLRWWPRSWHNWSHTNRSGRPPTSWVVIALIVSNIAIAGTPTPGLTRIEVRPFTIHDSRTPCLT